MEAINRAREKSRKAIESMYSGFCDIYEYRKVKDSVTEITAVAESQVVEKQPCLITFSVLQSAAQSDSVSSLVQSIKLFIAPEITINPGSKIVVTQNGRTTEYKNSGQPAVYTTHQEINLELYEGRA